MNLTDFWRVVDESLSAANTEERMQELGQIVRDLPVAEYRDFLSCFDQLKKAISSSDEMVNAACLANEGCLSLDTFDYFCYWLIGSGSSAYEQALRDPDSIVDLMCIHGHPQLEEFGEALSSGPCIADAEPKPEIVSIRGRIWTNERQQKSLPRLHQYSMT